MKTTASKYLVMSAGRCASNLVCEYLSEVLQGNSQRMATKTHTLQSIRHAAAENLVLNRSTIVHDHELWQPVPKHSWRLITVTRSNTWAQALSWCTARRTKEFHQYTGQKFSYHLEWDELQQTRKWIEQKNRDMEKLATAEWKSVTRLSLEDFITDVDSIRSRVPGFYRGRELDLQGRQLHSRQSPHTPGSVIENWWEIEQQIKRKS